MNLNDANQMVAQLREDAHQFEHAHPVDMAEVFAVPTDLQLLDALVEAFDLTAAEMLERLARIDVAALRKGAAQ